MDKLINYYSVMVKCYTQFNKEFLKKITKIMPLLELNSYYHSQKKSLKKYYSNINQSKHTSFRKNLKMPEDIIIVSNIFHWIYNILEEKNHH